MPRNCPYPAAFEKALQTLLGPKGVQTLKSWLPIFAKPGVSISFCKEAIESCWGTEGQNGSGGLGKMPRNCPYPAAFEKALQTLLGPKGVITDPEVLAPHLRETRGIYKGGCYAMALPTSTQEVSATLKLCHDYNVKVVPQGGNTGHVAGALAREEDRALLINLSRMDRVLQLDPANNTMTVQAGCILRSLQEAAKTVERIFPLSLGAEGSCQIGGNIATNAGGVHVLRYGSTRDLVLGLEVVLPDGRIWDGLRALRKDNSGLDIKSLFIGSEGTLGIVTAAVLKLFPKPKSSVSALVCLCDLDQLLPLLNRAQSHAGEWLTAFELMPRLAIQSCIDNAPHLRVPLQELADWHVLLEISSGQDSLRALVELLLEEAFRAEEITDAAVAMTEAQSRDLWKIREQVSLEQVNQGASIKHDVSVPLQEVPAFLRTANRLVSEMMPGIKPYAFGHAGDGNIHYNLSQPEDMGAQKFLNQRDSISKVVHDLVRSMKGSIAAEHGVGLRKAAENKASKSDVEWHLMQQIKIAFDPKGLMNPGKFFPED